MQRRKYALLKQPFEMDTLGDVNLTNPVLGDVLYFDGTYWINSPYGELVDDRVNSLLVAGNNIDITYNDGANTLTIDVEGLTTADLSDFNEAVDDRVAALIQPGNNIDVTYNDTLNTFTIDVEGLTSADISDFSEAVDDRVAALATAGTGMSITYSDVGNTLTFAISGLTASNISDFSEAVDDRVSSLLVAGTGITLTYNDGANTLTVAASGGSGDVATDAIWDAKGDLAVGTGANTASRLAVGTNGYVLTADSAASTGVKWATVGALGLDINGLTALSGLLDEDADYFPVYDASATANRKVLLQAMGGFPRGDIDTEIAADSPTGYWKMNEASGNFADSSGNGYTLTAGSGVTYQLDSYIPGDTRKGALFSTGAASRATAATALLGLSTPIATCTMEFYGIATQSTYPVMAFTTSGETEATNVQLQWRVTSNSQLEVLWEKGAGANVTFTGSLFYPLGRPNHVVVVKDGTNRVLTVYVNGYVIYSATWVSGDDSTGGSSTVFTLGGEPAGGSSGVFALAAVYSTALSASRVKVHARALGCRC